MAAQLRLTKPVHKKTANVVHSAVAVVVATATAAVAVAVSTVTVATVTKVTPTTKNTPAKSRGIFMRIFFLAEACHCLVKDLTLCFGLARNDSRHNIVCHSY